MNRQQWAALNANEARRWPVEAQPNQRAARADTSRPIPPRPPVRPNREDGRG